MKDINFEDNNFKDDFVQELCDMILNTGHELEKLNICRNKLTDTSLNNLINLALKNETLKEIRYDQDKFSINRMQFLHEKYPNLDIISCSEYFIKVDENREGCNVYFLDSDDFETTYEFLTEEGFAEHIRYEVKGGNCCTLSNALSHLNEKWRKIAIKHINESNETDEDDPFVSLVEDVLLKGDGEEFQVHVLDSLLRHGADFTKTSSDGKTTLLDIALKSKKGKIVHWVKSNISDSINLDDLDLGLDVLD